MVRTLRHLSAAHFAAASLACGGGNERGFVAQNAGDYHDSFIGLFPLLCSMASRTAGTVFTA